MRAFDSEPTADDSFGFAPLKKIFQIGFRFYQNQFSARFFAIFFQFRCLIKRAVQKQIRCVVRFVLMIENGFHVGQRTQSIGMNVVRFRTSESDHRIDERAFVALRKIIKHE